LRVVVGKKRESFRPLALHCLQLRGIWTAGRRDYRHELRSVKVPRSKASADDLHVLVPVASATTIANASNSQAWACSDAATIQMDQLRHLDRRECHRHFTCDFSLPCHRLYRLLL
jgi:hypothetical protein